MISHLPSFSSPRVFCLSAWWLTAQWAGQWGQRPARIVLPWRSPALSRGCQAIRDPIEEVLGWVRRNQYVRGIMGLAFGVTRSFCLIWLLFPFLFLAGGGLTERERNAESHLGGVPQKQTPTYEPLACCCTNYQVELRFSLWIAEIRFVPPKKPNAMIGPAQIPTNGMVPHHGFKVVQNGLRPAAWETKHAFL